MKDKIVLKNVYCNYKVPDIGPNAGFLKRLVNNKYKEIKVLDGISFTVDKGSVAGYIGLNGAGKTTTIKNMTGIVYPSKGEIDILGFNPFANRTEFVRNIGAVFGNINQLNPSVTVRDNFSLMKYIYDIPKNDAEKRVREFSEMLRIDHRLDSPSRTLSLGERVKCNIIMSLLHNPDILFLDEPTIGVDIISKNRIIKFIKHISSNLGTTVFITSHNMQDIEELSSKIIMLNNGSIIYEGSQDGLREFSSLRKSVLVEFNIATKLDSDLILWLKRNDFILKKINDMVYKIYLSDTNHSDSFSRLYSRFSDYNNLKNFSIENASLERMVETIYEKKI